MSNEVVRFIRGRKAARFLADQTRVAEQNRESEREERANQGAKNAKDRVAHKHNAAFEGLQKNLLDGGNLGIQQDMHDIATELGGNFEVGYIKRFTTRRESGIAVAAGIELKTWRSHKEYVAHESPQDPTTYSWEDRRRMHTFSIVLFRAYRDFETAHLVFGEFDGSLSWNETPEEITNWKDFTLRRTVTGLFLGSKKVHRYNPAQAKKFRKEIFSGLKGFIMKHDKH